VLSAIEIARGMKGALGFLQRDPAAPSYFENTAEACVRSFLVMVLVAPLYAVLMLIRFSYVSVASGEFEIIAVEILRYVVDWLLFPVLFYEIARQQSWLGLAALNWVNLPAMIVAVAGVVLATLLPVAMADLIRLALQALFFYWFLVTTRSVLNVGWGPAVLLLAVNWLPSLFLSLIVDRFLGVTAGIG
jgi:hypothetical protein